MMRRLWLGLLLIAAVLPLAQAGDIQVLCEPGLRVYLDGEFAGLSTEKEDGLFLMDLGEGRHSLWIEKDGFLSQRFEVDLRSIPLEVKVGAFKPVPQSPVAAQRAVREKTEQRVGTVVVTSAPQNCKVTIDGEVHEKRSPQLTVGGLSAGQHTVVFEKPGFESVRKTVDVQPGAEVRVRGNLKAGGVDVTHAGHGSLRLTSTPKQCTVWFLGKTRDKTGMRFNLSRVPAGEHPLRIQCRGMSKTLEVLIKNGQRALVDVSFLKGQKPVTIDYETE